ncbi:MULTISPECIES: TetR family transcriptional regulator [unclassified Nocardia]|uniref:TetR family transcriptional regulator n=1 Tax=unclassified Nocardia TaxID=2637762 RepID=UPI001CE4208A|nr:MULTISPECIES: TetR family transcriptional regulator [unclassified Nocardia]
MRRSTEDAARTRAALIDAALRVFAERGYTATTLAAVSERAGVTRGAAYHHFTDKAALFLATVEEEWTRAAEPIWAHLDEPNVPPLERIRRYLVAFYTALERDRRVRDILMITSYRVEALPELDAGLRGKRDMMRRWVSQLATVLSDAELRDGVDADTAALAIVAQINGVIVTWFANTDLFSPAARADQLADTALNGIH